MWLFVTGEAIAIGRSHATVGARNDLIRCVTRSVVVAPRIETRDRDLVKRRLPGVLPCARQLVQPEPAGTTQARQPSRHRCHPSRVLVNDGVGERSQQLVVLGTVHPIMVPVPVRSGHLDFRTAWPSRGC